MEVGQAGQYSYVPGMTVQEGNRHRPGAYSPRAHQRDVDIQTRTINGEILTGRVRITDPKILRGRQTIYVREAAVLTSWQT